MTLHETPNPPDGRASITHIRKRDMPAFHETETTEKELQLLTGALCCMLADDVPECRDGNGHPSPPSIAAHMLETAKQHGVALDMASLSGLIEEAVEAHRAATRASS